MSDKLFTNFFDFRSTVFFVLHFGENVCNKHVETDLFDTYMCSYVEAVFMKDVFEDFMGKFNVKIYIFTIFLKMLNMLGASIK